MGQRLFGNEITPAGFKQLAYGQLSDAMVDLREEVEEKRVVPTVELVLEQLSKLAFLPWHRTAVDAHIMGFQVRCLELLARYLNMFGEKDKDKKKEDLAKDLKEAWRRVNRIGEKAAKLTGN